MIQVQSLNLHRLKQGSPYLVPLLVVGFALWLQSYVLLSLTLLAVMVSKIVEHRSRSRLYLIPITGFVLTVVTAYPSRAATCQAGFLNQAATGFSNAFDTIGATEVGKQICALGDIFTGGIVFMGVASIVSGAWRQSHGEDIKNAWMPMMVLAFIFVAILLLNKFAYTTTTV